MYLRQVEKMKLILLTWASINLKTKETTPFSDKVAARIASCSLKKMEAHTLMRGKNGIWDCEYFRIIRLETLENLIQIRIVVSSRNQ
jgi:hypothetical protein